MRRIVFVVLGVLEFAACALLLYFAWQLPGPTEVEDTFGRVEKVSRNAGRQVHNLRDQVAVIRKRQPELLTLSRQLQKQMQSVSANIKDRNFDSRGLETISGALGDVARGLDGVSTALDPKGIVQLGKGLGSTAAYIEDKVVPAAEKAATTLEKGASSLKHDGSKLKGVLAGTPAQLAAAKAVATSLKKFEDGLGRMERIAKMQNLDAMEEGFKGLETSLDTGAGQVEKVSNRTIPKVTVRGLRITVEQQDFWPDGKEIAAGMRKAAKGCKAARAELATVKKEMPKVREGLAESRKVVSATRTALEQALANQEKIEPLLKTLPANLAKLVDELPTVMAELGRILRETSRLKDAAEALRLAQKGIETAGEHWPDVQKGLKASATMLRATQKQLNGALSHRGEYEATVKQTVELTALFATALPVMIEQLEDGLERQEKSLGDLGDSIDQVSETLPGTARSASRLLMTTRWLLCLVALMVSFHAGYLLLGWRLGPAYSGDAS